MVHSMSQDIPRELSETVSELRGLEVTRKASPDTTRVGRALLAGTAEDDWGNSAG